MSKPDREAMLDRGHPKLSIRRQCALLGLARSGVYRPRKAANDDDLAVMRRLDGLFLAHPFLGSRRMVAMLRAEGGPINRKRVQRLMRTMGIAAIGPKPRTSKPAPGHKIYPYLLGDMVIDRPNQVWAADITYIPMARGFLYLVAIIDWASRAVLAWRLSNSIAKRSHGVMSAKPTGTCRSASRRLTRRSHALASPRSSTPIRAASSPV
jgi:putative transposase